MHKINNNGVKLKVGRMELLERVTKWQQRLSFGARKTIASLVIGKQSVEAYHNPKRDTIQFFINFRAYLTAQWPVINKKKHEQLWKQTQIQR
jgi:hypothetical protein